MLVSLATSVNTVAPSPMNAPASMPSMLSASSGNCALAMQNCSTRPAIWRGE